MRTLTSRPKLAVAAAVWLLVELLRAWAPLLITVFGRAAETPPELIGAFALAVTATPLLAMVVLGRWLHGPRGLQAAVAVAALARILLIGQAGRPLLVITTLGVMAALLGVALSASRYVGQFVPGLFAGIALATVTHALLGTWGAVWRVDWPGLVVTGTMLVLVIMTHVRPIPTVTASLRRPIALATLPVLLIAGVALANPARAMVSDARGAIVVAVASTVAAGVSRRSWPRPVQTLGAAGLVAATAIVMLPDPLPVWSLLGFALGMPCAGLALSGSPSRESGRPSTTSRWVASGAVVFTALLFAIYAGYDLGYRADWVPVLVAAVVALTAVANRRDPTVPARPATTPLPSVACVVLAAVAAWAGPTLTIRPLAGTAGPDSAAVGFAAYNVRMGYGIDGTFRPDEVARLLLENRSEVVVLSEVDRGWLLNGGQDQLTILARLLDMHFSFGPAADQVWGDAILSRRPITDVDRLRLPDYDSLTGAQVMAATTTTTVGPLRVVSTHIQPDSDGDEPSLRQARDIRTFVAEQQVAGRPIVMGGDFNLEPGGAEFSALTAPANGQALVDALGSARPLLTSSSDDPRKQIDHVLVTTDLGVQDPRTVATQLSDHLPVFVDLTRP